MKTLMEKMKDNMAFIITMVTILSLAFGTYFYFEKHFASAEELTKTQQQLIQTQQRLDYKILSDQAHEVQQRIWTLDDRFRGKVMDQTTLEQYRELQATKIELEKALDALIKQGISK